MTTLADQRPLLARLIGTRLAWLTGAGYAAHTVRSRRSYLAHFARWCDAQGLDDPGQLTLSLLERYHTSRRLPGAVLTAAEVKQVLAVPDLTARHGIRDQAILEVLYSTVFGALRWQSSR